MAAAAPYQDTNPTELQIIDALAKAFDAPPSAAVAWLTMLQKSFDPKAAQELIAQREGERHGF